MCESLFFRFFMRWQAENADFLLLYNREFGKLQQQLLGTRIDEIDSRLSVLTFTL